MNIITEQEEVEIRKFVNNPIMLNAVKKLLLMDIYASGTLEPGKDPDPARNFALSFLFDPLSGNEYNIDNARLGEKLRAALEGIRLVQTSFNKL